MHKSQCRDISNIKSRSKIMAPKVTDPTVISSVGKNPRQRTLKSNLILKQQQQQQQQQNQKPNKTKQNKKQLREGKKLIQNEKK